MRSLDEIRNIKDDHVVRMWLADRGLVAVERQIMERFCYPNNGNVCYNATLDRYVEIKSLRPETAQ